MIIPTTVTENNVPLKSIPSCSSTGCSFCCSSGIIQLSLHLQFFSYVFNIQDDRATATLLVLKKLTTVCRPILIIHNFFPVERLYNNVSQFIQEGLKTQLETIL